MNQICSMHGAPAVLAVLAGLSVAAAGEPQAQELTTAQVAARATPATVTIITLGSEGDTVATGSGFILRADGTIVTNWHVLRGASAATVVRANGEIFRRVEFLDGDSTADIAIIKIPGYGLPTLTPRSTTPSVGERVIAIGSPLGLSKTVTEGIVSADRIMNGREYVQISAAISPGSSGGAVLDSKGRVFAISTAYIEGGQQLNFAVPVRYALGLLQPEMRGRPLASVFGAATGAATRAAGGDADRAGRAIPDGVGASVGTVRTDLSGVYALEITSEHGASAGLLVSTGTNGWVTLGTRGFWVTHMGTNQAGDVLLVIGQLTFDGRQTRGGGFVVQSSDTIMTGTNRVRITATPENLPLSDPRGLYDVQCNTRSFLNGKEVPLFTNWSGTLAVNTDSADVFLSLAIANDGGGSRFLNGSSPLVGGRSFDIRNNRDKRQGGLGGYVRLTGEVAPGTITGRWVDETEPGTWFECPLVATRR